ncbi:hypothetical protein QAD02_009909 [Eretmocerus hayati]|uniref:Uncharacterized protein n=1 Tax=Eretmocerus hayati TaxID=131215 RepID=A0ACC2NC10_9HYME|nr:hypothetical protein QAD02_009909 [Eretmocerus hayati]
MDEIGIVIFCTVDIAKSCGILSKFLFEAVSWGYFYIQVKAKPLSGKPLKTAEEEYPFSVLIVGKISSKGNTQLVCTGSLISRNQVLTAASCLEGKQLADLQAIVSIGKTKVKKKGIFDISSKVTYENYMTELRLRKQFKPSEIEDLAILELSVEDTGITPARISFKTDIPKAGHTVKIVGFNGKDTKLSSPRVAYGSLTVLDKKLCDDQAKLIAVDYRRFVWTNRIICAQTYPPILANNGDFGGPILNEKGKIVGISFKGRSDSEPIRLIPKGQANLILRIGWYEDFITTYKH